MKLIFPCILISAIMLSVLGPSFVLAETDKNSNSTMVLRGGVLGGVDYPLNGTYSQMVFFSGNVGRVQTGQSVVIKIFEGSLLYKTDLLPASNIAQDGSFSYQTTVKGKLGLDNKIVFTYGNQTVEEILPHAHTGIPPPNLSTQPQPVSSSPLKQYKTGISTYGVICNQGFVLVIKKSDNSPACVKPDTAQKLVERGWGAWTVQTSWFKSELASGFGCKNIPWIRELVKSNKTSALIQSMTNGTLVKEYFNNHGITLFQMKASLQSTQNTVDTCGYGTFYFLVSQNDTSKMIELGFKSTDEKEVQDSGASVINLTNAEQKVWVEYTPIQCHAPWDVYWNKLYANTTSMILRGSEFDIIKEYFQGKGITILDSRVTIPLTMEAPPQCGHLSQNTYYFLVPQSDAKKMVDLGYTIIEEKEVCSPNGRACMSTSQMR